MPDDYQRIAPVYDLILDPLLNPLRRRISNIMQEYRVGKVVDLGCGTGKQCAFLHRANLDVYGVDRSASMLSKASNNTPEGIKYQLQDFTSTAFQDNYFQASLISLVLHEHDQKTQHSMLTEARRVTEQGGITVILEHHVPDSLSSWIMHHISCIPERLAGRRHYHNYISFMKNRGLPGLLDSRHDLIIVRAEPYFFGGLMLYVLKCA
ncbi:class I SAM-dependent methyltransferase [Desulfonatronovibrio magnus]|uniref:class I SAM-dependent methyltransferase n=1 Tax=Desulfonatronovibrio magnus TaxID=698827 RepID=UPI0005EADA1B|nr:methyltransferase domain-containing protein [Desulfonatronovibrio magnus]